MFCLKHSGRKMMQKNYNCSGSCSFLGTTFLGLEAWMVSSSQLYTIKLDWEGANVRMDAYSGIRKNLNSKFWWAWELNVRVRFFVKFHTMQYWRARSRKHFYADKLWAYVSWFILQPPRENETLSSNHLEIPSILCL